MKKPYITEEGMNHLGEDYYDSVGKKKNEDVFWKENEEDKKIKINQLEKRIESMIQTIKNSPEGWGNSVRVFKLSNMAKEYKDLTGRCYRTKSNSKGY